ncbi:hypothetical protein PYV02_07500 [Leifsonia sp. H3M29-4]|nr:hypothetical protein [Salinibacterium metalliresistens]MDF1478930.1 hypothetical protein [Salinibacterium metalliresistens]
MADELDLCMERVPKAAAAYQLSTLSSAHWLKHEVVEDIAITERSKPDEGKVVGFTVKIRTYRNLPKADARAVGEWIRDKLISQIALTESEMIASYDGQYRFDRRVDISLRDSPTMDCRSARPEVLALIRADNAKADLINHEECTATCRSHLESGTSVVVVGKMSEQDNDSREDVFELLCAYERVAGSDVRVITRHQSKPHTSASDLLAPWLQNPNLEQKTVKQHETVRRDLFLAALQNELLRSAGPTTLALSSIGALSKEVRSWFLAEAIPKLNALPGVRLLITADARIPAAHLEGLWAQQAVRKTAVRDLHAYLAKHWASGETVPPGITYSHARWYRLNLYAEAASA